jgi:hypoxanthine phosphoribosyltransferase
MNPEEKLHPLYSAEEIAGQLQHMAQQIAADVEEEIIVVSLLKGSFVFTADLVRALSLQGCRLKVEFLGLSSYGDKQTSSKKVTIVQDMTVDIAGKSILIVDDILDTGRTLQFASNLLRDRGAKLIKIAVMLEKPGKRSVSIDADYIGFSIPDKFVVGYGLDYAGYYRELPYIGTLEQRFN